MAHPGIARRRRHGAGAAGVGGLRVRAADGGLRRHGGHAWHLEVRPGLWQGSARLVVGGQGHDLGGLPLRAALADTLVVVVGEEATVVVGPVPRGAGSVRVASLQLGVREAGFRRVGWRRVHVEVLEGPVEVTQLVAIAPDGRILEVVEDPEPVVGAGPW